MYLQRPRMELYQVLSAMSPSAQQSKALMEQKPLSQWLHQQTDYPSDSSTTKTDVTQPAVQNEFKSNPRQKYHTAELGFLYWVAYIRKYDPNVNEVQRKTCPLTECQKGTFSDEEDMLKHIRFCSGLSKGLYHCCECNSSEKISKVHKSGCKERRPRKHSFTGLLDQVRRGISRSPSLESTSLRGSPVRMQSLPQIWAEMPHLFPPNYTDCQELPDTALCELGTNFDCIPAEIGQQDCPAELEVANTCEADKEFLREEELFAHGSIYNPGDPNLGHDDPPPYSAKAQWVAEKTNVCDPVQAHPMECSRPPNVNTSFHSEYSTYNLTELPDTSWPVELDAASTGSLFDSTFDVHQVAGIGVATSSRPNILQCSSYEASRLQLAQLDTNPKYTIDQPQLMPSCVSPPPSNSILSSSQRLLFVDQTAPLAPPYGSSYQWSSSAYTNQPLESSLNNLAEFNGPQKSSSPNDLQYHQAGFVSPIGSDTSSNFNITISSASSISSSIDQLLAKSKNQSGTDRASLHHGHFPYAWERRSSSTPGQTDQPALIDQSILDPIPERIDSSSFGNHEKMIVDSSQTLLTCGLLDKERFNEDHTCKPQQFIHTLDNQQLHYEAPSRVDWDHSSATPSDMSTNNSEPGKETAKHRPTAISATPRAGDRCVCGYEPKPDGKEKNKASNLKRHQKTCKIYSPQNHNDRPFPCSFTGCSKAYPRSDALAVHMRSKHGPLSNMKASSETQSSKRSKVENGSPMNADSSSQRRLRRQGVVYALERPKRRAPSLSPQQHLSEDGAIQKVVPKRRRLIGEKPVEPCSWL